MSFSEFSLFSFDIIYFDCNSFARILFLPFKNLLLWLWNVSPKALLLSVWYRFHFLLYFCVFVIEKSFFSVLIKFVLVAFFFLLSSFTFYIDLSPPYCCGLMDLKSKKRWRLCRVWLELFACEVIKRDEIWFCGGVAVAGNGFRCRGGCSGVEESRQGMGLKVVVACGVWERMCKR